MHLSANPPQVLDHDRQPVVARARPSSSWPRKRPRNLRTAVRSAGTTLVRCTSPVSVSIHSPVICVRCRSRPTTVVMRGLLKLHGHQACAARFALRLRGSCTSLVRRTAHDIFRGPSGHVDDVPEPRDQISGSMLSWSAGRTGSGQADPVPGSKRPCRRTCLPSMSTGCLEAVATLATKQKPIQNGYGKLSLLVRRD
jgi:hypothetical protein